MVKLDHSDNQKTDSLWRSPTATLWGLLFCSGLFSGNCQENINYSDDFFKYLITFLHTILYSLIGFDYVFCSTSATLSPNPKLRIFRRQCKTTLASHCIVYPFIQCPLQFVLLFIPNMILRQNSLTGNYLSNLSIRTQSLPAEFQIKIFNNKDRPSLLGLP